MKGLNTAYWNDVLAVHRGKIVGLLLVLATLFVYSQVAQFDFVNYDDGEYVSSNPYVTGGLTSEGLAWAFTAFHHSNWHPVTWLSHMLDVQLFGMDPGAHHVVNLLFHTLNSLLLFHLLRTVTASVWRSALVAALFALHPLHVESVAWIAERKDVLSTLFWLLAILSYHRYVSLPSFSRYLVVFAAMALGLMSKPMVVTLPFVLLLLDFWPLNRPETRLLRTEFSYRSIRGAWPLVREKLPLFALTAASCALTYYAQKQGGAMTAAAYLDAGTRVGNAMLAYGIYVVKTIVPANLAVFYPYPDPLPWFKVGMAAVCVALATIAFLRLRNRAPYLAVGWLWFTGTLVPVIGIVQVGGQAMADRYTYIPLIGLFVMIAWGAVDIIGRLPKSRPVILTAFALGLAILTGVSTAQVRHWKDSETLFGHALAVTSDNAVVRNNLGQALAVNGKLQEAAEQFRLALAFDHGQEIVHVNLGKVLEEQGKIEDAVHHYLLASKLKPNAEKTHNKLGLAYEKLEKTGKAIYHYQLALRLKPDFSEAQTNLGNLYFSVGDYEKAVSQYRQVLQLNPSSVQVLNNMGLAFEKLGSRDWAIKHYQQALKLDPDFARAHGNLGVAYFRSGEVDRAILHLEKAVELDPEYHIARQNLEKALEIGAREKVD